MSEEAAWRHAAGLHDVNVLLTELGNGNATDHRTCLDKDQLQALLACFRQQLTLIQGPPGTGALLLTLALAVKQERFLSAWRN